MGFVANFIRFPALQIFENRLRFDKVAESLKVLEFKGGNFFLRHSVVMLTYNLLINVFYLSSRTLSFI